MTHIFRQSSTCLQLSQRHIHRNVNEIIPSAAEKSYSGSVTHFVIGKGAGGIKKRGREDTRISTDRWDGSFPLVRHSNYSITSLLLLCDTLTIQLFYWPWSAHNRLALVLGARTITLQWPEGKVILWVSKFMFLFIYATQAPIGWIIIKSCTWHFLRINTDTRTI